MFFGDELKDRAKIEVADECFDALQDIAKVQIINFTVKLDLLSREGGPSWKIIIDETIELSGVPER